jgi:hypothetical protein
VGFLNPASLVFGLSLAALVLIYLRARSRPTIDVSSLMLFDEVPAPVAKSRVLRVDALFFLESIALAALTLAVAGFYIRAARAAGPHPSRALVFDVGAGMGAADNGATRLDEAKQTALRLVSDAPPGDEFSVIAYALEAETIRARTNRASGVRAAIAGLRPLAVAARPAALRAALIDAHGSAAIDLFADRAPSKALIDDARPGGRVETHLFGAPADNLAIVSLDPGLPRGTQGRCVLRNFSPHPQMCELKIDAGGREVFHSSLILEPRAELIVPFGPLAQGGLVRAAILTRDALAADNSRYALARGIGQAHALVLSPDADVRDDLARIVLAINPNYLVAAADPAQFAAGHMAARRYDLAVLHDCADTGVNAAAKLFIFPEPWLRDSKRAPLAPVIGTVAMAELQSRGGAPLATPALLGPARVVALPGWMDALAQGAGAGEAGSFPLAAIGRNPESEIGVITFDIRNHLLLDPDRMDALVLMVDVLKRLAAPRDVKVVPTGEFVPISIFGAATLTPPDGPARTLAPDQWGRVHFRPLQAGRYTVTGNHRVVEVFANYYDAAESDLAAPAAGTGPHPHSKRSAEVHRVAGIEPFAYPLIALALLLFMAESALIARRTMRWRVRHV